MRARQLHECEAPEKPFAGAWYTDVLAPVAAAYNIVASPRQYDAVSTTRQWLPRTMPKPPGRRRCSPRRPLSWSVRTRSGSDCPYGQLRCERWTPPPPPEITPRAVKVIVLAVGGLFRMVRARTRCHVCRALHMTSSASLLRSPVRIRGWRPQTGMQSKGPSAVSLMTCHAQVPITHVFVSPATTPPPTSRATSTCFSSPPHID